MRSFDKRRFANATALFGFLLIPSFVAAWAADEGTLGTNIIWVVFFKLFYILRFPTHTLFWAIFCNAGIVVYLSGLIINCMFYGFLTERIYSVFRQEKVN
jgi:hypothetical protein